MDQYGNNIDDEIRIPIKDFHTKAEWRPLGRNSWIEKFNEDNHIDFVDSSIGVVYEWSIAYADGKVDDVAYVEEGEALRELQNKRRTLKQLGVPEEYWPVLVSRSIETLRSSWSIHRD